VGGSFSKTEDYVDTRTNDPSWSNGYLSNAITQSSSIGTSDLLKGNYNFGKHTVSGFVGFEYGVSNLDYVDASGTNPPNGLSVLNVVVPLDVNGYKTPGKSASFLSQFQYSYDNKLFATLSYRRDGSSLFGEDNRWGNFPAAAVSWLASEEKFLKDSNAITYLKFRTSYGVTGNSNINAFKYLALYSFSSQYNNQVGAIPENLSNPYLGWETAYMANFGVDLELYHRVNITVDLYNNENKNLLLDVPVSLSSGFDYQTRNSGSVRNRGLELNVSTINLNGKFKWTTDFNISFNNNRIMSLPEGEDYILQTVDGVNQKISVGNDMFTWYMPKWAGVDPDNGDPLWECQTFDENGKVVSTELTNDYTKANLQEVGSASPKFTGGFDNNFSYCGFALSVTTNFVYGNEIYNYDRQDLDSDGAYPGYNMMKLKKGWSRWEKAGDIATHPKLVMNGNKDSNKTSSRYLEDGSFLRIRNIKLSYELPSSWTKSIRLASAKIYVSGDNLFTFTSFSGMDPEVNMRTEDWNLAGFYYSSYPVSRQYMFGIELKF
jgi:TonB-linked SusC/RagA family outer membrane protein